MDAKSVLKNLLTVGLQAADPGNAVRRNLPRSPKGRTPVVGAGKAAASMAKAVEEAWPEDAPLEGLVVTRYGYGLGLQRIACIEAGHPVPDEASQASADRILRLVGELGPDDLALALISGGGSALLAKPAPGLSMADKKRITNALLASGAPIGAINTVRKHLSAIKGGRLALAAHPAKLVTLAVSDVAGDDPSVIASGPTLGDPTTVEDAQSILAKLGIAPPPAWSESPKPDDPRMRNADYRLILKPADMLDSVADKARALGLDVVELGDRVEGEACDMALQHAKLALAAKPGTLILSGGELTVTMKGHGKGGPNSEYLLALALALSAAPGIHALSVDSDGIDGNQDCAGAIIAPDTLAKARALGLDPASLLAANDSYAFFASLGQNVVTGPTRTNLNDLRLLLVL